MTLEGGAFFIRRVVGFPRIHVNARYKTKIRNTPNFEFPAEEEEEERQRDLVRYDLIFAVSVALILRNDLPHVAPARAAPRTRRPRPIIRPVRRVRFARCGANCQ